MMFKLQYLGTEVLYDWMEYLLPSVWEENPDVKVKRVPVVVCEQTSRPDYGLPASVVILVTRYSGGSIVSII